MDPVIAPDAVPFLERQRELHALARALSAAERGHGQLVLVEGHGGVGKSRLLDEALARGAQGATVLRAAGVELERDFPFGVTVQLFGDLLHNAPGDERRALLSGAAGLAAQLFVGQTADVAGRSTDFSLLHGLHWLVANLAERGPLVLVVDDAHWADRMTLRFLCYLARRLEGLPVLAVVAHRPVGEGAGDDLLVELAGSPGAQRLTPEPLGLDAVTALIGVRHRQPSEAFVAACHEATGGNPLLVRELLAALDEEGVAPDEAGAARAREIGPRSVWRAIELQLRRLGDDATALARAAAVLGDGAELADAAALARASLQDAALAARALQRSGVLLPSSLVGFAHPILRQAVVEQLDPIELASAHRDAARLLHGRADVERVAAHLLPARVDRERWATEVLSEAGRRALRSGAPASAARLFGRAREESEDPLERAALALDEGRAAAQAGLPDAATRLEVALADQPTDLARAEVLLELGQAHLGRGAYGASVAAFEAGLQALAEVPGGAAIDELRLELECGYVAAGLWEPSMGVAVLERVAPLMRPDREPRSASERALLASLGGGEMLSCGDRGLAVDLVRRAWGDGAFLSELGPDDPSLPAITGVLNQADELDFAHEVGDAVLRAAARTGSLTAHGTFSYIRGATRYFQGRLADAIADLEAARSAEELGWEQFLAAGRWMLAVAALEAGDLERARSAVVLHPEAEARVRGTVTFAGLLNARGLLALHDGDAARALRVLEESASLQQAMGLRNPALLGWRVPLAQACARLGDLERARAVAAEDLELTAAWGAPRALSQSLRAVGQLAESPEERRDHLLRAVGVVQGSGARVEEAHAFLALGSALRREGKRTRAHEPLRTALDLADRCGARPLAARAREELQAVGVRPRRARLSGPGALTPSERRVARLAADGLTNRAIAESLFVTRKAVEYHLGNVYRKLGARSREDLPALLDATASDVEA